MIKLSMKERYILYDLFEGLFFNAVFVGEKQMKKFFSNPETNTLRYISVYKDY